MFTEIKERGHPDADMLSVTITKGVIRQRALLAGSTKKDSSNLDKSAYKLARPGDIAYNKMRAWQGAVGVFEYQGIVSPAYIVQRPREGADSHFLHYLLRTPAFAKEAERWFYGIASDMWSLRPEHFKMIYSCLPPLAEQAAVVRFLDHADPRIRRYIRAKQKLIKLLEEQKQAIIHRAVTRGLNPNVRFKPSGVEWLGGVPEHWDLVRLGCLIDLTTGFPFKSEGFTQDGADIRLLRGAISRLAEFDGPTSCGGRSLIAKPITPSNSGAATLYWGWTDRSFEEALRIVDRLRQRFGESDLFGVEKGKGLASALGAIIQTFGGEDLYLGLEEKAAHLLVGGD